MQTHDLQTPYLSVIVPAYNEESRIGSTILGLSAYLKSLGKPYELLIVLNNCTDNTRGIIEIEQAHNPNIKVLDLGMISGVGNTKGVAVAKGMMASLGTYAVFTDADLATPAEEIGKLLHIAITTKKDLVIGSRRATGADVKREQVWYRNLLGRLANKLIQLLLLPGIQDTQCGCKLFTRKAVRDIFPKMTTGGWGFDIEVLARAKKLGYSVTEVGVRWHDVAESKVGGGAYISTLKDLISIWVKVK